MAAAVIAVAAVVFGLIQARHASAFRIETVRVTGVSRVSTETVLRYADVPASATLFEVNRVAIARRVARDPWIASAAVTRDFPHTLVITVRERKPGLWARVNKRTSWLVSTDATWLAPKGKEPTSTLPVATDIDGLEPEAGKPVDSPEVRNALAVLTGLSTGLRKTVAFISAPSIEKTALVTKSGVQIFVGPATEMKKKDAVILAILAQHKGKLVYINVRTPDRPTWRGLDSP